VISIVGSAETVLKGTDEKREVFNTQDGFFTVFQPIGDDDMATLTEGGTQIQAEFCTDLSVDDDRKLRMFKNRTGIDKLILDKGRLADKDDECVIEKRYADENGISVGDKITAGGHDFTVTGVGAVPDYEQPKDKLSDTAVQSKYFGLIFVTGECYDNVRSKGDLPLEEYVYAYKLGSGMTDSELKDKIASLKQQSLISFVKRADNKRIEAAADIRVMHRNTGLAAGIVILVLFGYVISVFVVHRIESEAPVIGALYALGVRKKDLLRHYITLPTIVAFIGGIIGTLLGFSPIGIGTKLNDAYDHFSLPQYDIYYAPYLLVYGLILPPVISAIVNALVINKKLSRTALSLIKNEQSASSYRRFNIRAKSFVTVFRIRQIVRELRSAVTVVFGMFVSLLVVMLGVDSYVMCEALKTDNTADTHYEYMYLLKYPDKEIPAGGESAYVKTLSTEFMGNSLDVTVIGLNEESKYFDARPEKGKNKIIVNNSLVERYGYKNGDKVTFTDSADDSDYSFTVTDTTQYSPGFTVFMDIRSMRELFGQSDDYYNAVFSDKVLDIDSGRLYSITSKEDVEKSAGVFAEQMSSLIYTMLIMGSVIFIVVMYLMMGVMIDRSSFGISLIKIFGYRKSEVRRLYLSGNLTIVAVGALICIPLAKLIMDSIYPSFVANVACSMVLEFPPLLYLIIYGAVLAVYYVSSGMLTRKLSKITPAEVLKNRE
ncbi:MAG: FtsX-like permease family protein, partial [Ruminococcus sp.]|nr:FtsX-like permease family protein [Ruminococcus sp.]